MSYVDAFVAAVPKANRDEYKKHAEAADQCFIDHGALSVTECWGDDVPDGETTSFPMAVKCKADEVVVIGFVIWPSKEVRMGGMEKVMADPRMAFDGMPFDGKRLIYGGFESILDLQKGN